MQRLRFVIFVLVVFFGTMASYFYIRLKAHVRAQAETELGDPLTPGFREAFLADAQLVAKGSGEAAGNGSLAMSMARQFQEDLVNEFRDELGLPVEDDPLAIRMPRAYCLIREKYCIFLVYVPGLDQLSKDEQRALGLQLWPQAQALALTAIKRYPTVGIGLRGAQLYGPILVGAGTGEPLLAQDGGRYVFYPYFAGEPSLQPPPQVATQGAAQEPAGSSGN